MFSAEQLQAILDATAQLKMRLSPADQVRKYTADEIGQLLRMQDPGEMESMRSMSATVMTIEQFRKMLGVFLRKALRDQKRPGAESRDVRADQTFIAEEPTNEGDND